MMNLLRGLLLAICVTSAACDRGPEGRSAMKPGEGGRVKWVDIGSVQRGPIRRDSLSDEQMARIRALQVVFVEMDGLTVERWVDNFKRDVNPELELRVWERIARAYRAYCDGRQLSAAARKDVYRVALLRSMASERDVLERVELEALSRDEAIEVMKGF